MADNVDDVADDYRQALEDLTMNSRIEIATLTNIARENASHGFAIAEVLTNHIKKVPPARTLPALYVLDSVVKNVPTPYALYFGPKLYSIFMGAYTKVDNGTRRKMDEMLKTWKEPVPGSISTKPVFPPEHVRPIEQALVAARQAAFAANQNSFQGQQQLLQRGRPPMPPTRDTPTPPNARPPSHQAGPHGQQPFPGPNGHSQPPVAQQQPYPMRPLHDPSLQQQQQQQQPQRAPAQASSMPTPPAMNPLSRHASAGVSIDKLRDDVQQLIDADKADFLRNPHDASKQTRLRALLDLQTVIQRPDIPQDQLMLIKERVAELAVNMRTAPPPPVAAGPYPALTATPPVALPQYPIPAPIPPVAVPHPPPVTAGVGAVAAPGVGGGVTLDSLLGQGALAALLSKVPKPATPVIGNGFTPSVTPQLPPQSLPRPGSAMAAIRSPPPQMPGIQPPPSAPPAPSSLTANPSALLAMLRQSGLIKPTGPVAAVPPPASRTPVAAHTSLPAFAAPAMTNVPSQFTLASLKQNRPYVTPQLHEHLGPACTQCGRRFRTDEEGRRKKTAHMDWHFRVHQRIAEYEKRGQYRSPFVDEIDWIQTPVTVDIDYVPPTSTDDSSDAPNHSNTSIRNSHQQQKPKLQYIPVPDDSSRVNSICPICQERFEMKWLDEAQEWVWMDAVKIGDRVYHASCHREVAGDRREGTPSDGVLGKRKAEDDFQSGRKFKIESYGY